MIPSAVAASVFEAASPDVGQIALLLSPFHVARGFTLWFFAAPPEFGSQLAQADLPGVMYAISAASVALLMLALLLRRYERVSP